jgi:hypothetical protein
MENLKDLHPIAQLGIPLIITAGICFIIYVMFKGLSGSL